MTITVTHIGTATLLLEIGPWRILTDPALDPAGGQYRFAFGTGSTHTHAPALPPGGIGRIDAVLLTHDQHADNLDGHGRELLRDVPLTISTASAAPRLPRCRGLRPFDQTRLGDITVTATPARHGPPLSQPIVGDVIGFLLEWPGQRHGAVYISGDTVWFGGLRAVGRLSRVGTAFLHLGGVRFGISGPLRYTFNGEEAAWMARTLGAPHVLPIHYEGWTHFRQPPAEARAAFSRAGLSHRVTWLPYGVPTPLEV